MDAQLKANLDEWSARLAAQPHPPERLVALRSRQQSLRARLATNALEGQHLTPSRHRAMHAALSYVGTVENPPGSNTGKSIDTWQANFGAHAEPWCGAFVGSMTRIGGAAPTDRILYVPYIADDAEGHKNGLRRVVWERGVGWQGEKVGHTADLVLYDFGTNGILEHVGMLREPWHGAGPLKTIEGNTSFSNGSQSDGGCVALKERDPSLVKFIVAMSW